MSLKMRKAALKRSAALAICTVAACSGVFVATTEKADARPRRAAAVAGSVTGALPTNNDGKPTYDVTAATAGESFAQGPVSRRAAAASENTADVSFGYSGLVSAARGYIGTNPTGRSSLWCGAFMDMVLKKTGHAGGGNLARSYASYGTRISGPQVGAIAVMGRKGGGHVGVVSGIDANGNPIIISGNHNRTVAESTYPRGRITAYVMPN